MSCVGTLWSHDGVSCIGTLRSHRSAEMARRDDRRGMSECQDISRRHSPTLRGRQRSPGHAPVYNTQIPVLTRSLLPVHGPFLPSELDLSPGHDPTYCPTSVCTALCTDYPISEFI